VLYFDNNTGNPQLDWMRTGLADMLITDLSQSPDVEVVATDRLVQILTDLKHQDDRTIPSETVRQIAQRAGVKTVLVGSYVKAGDTIRINARLQEVDSGKIVTAERVDALNESSLFSAVDDLTKRIKTKFAGATTPGKALLTAPASTAAAGTPGGATMPLSLERDLTDVSTKSIDAYRAYVEGIDLHNRGREDQAVPPLEKAVHIDPTFAMALAKLATVEGNLGHPLKREEYAKRALDNVEHLSPRERYYIEGVYYGNKADSLNKAIDAYNKAIEVYPDHASARHNLAVLYSQIGRPEDAVPLYEELRRRHTAFPTTYTNLAAIYTDLGQYEKATDVLQEYIRANPDVPRGYAGLGSTLAASGRYDDALAAFDRASALDPGNLRIVSDRRAIAFVTERWKDLDAIHARLAQSSDPTWKAGSLWSQSDEQLYHGRSADALRLLDSAILALGPRGSVQTANMRLAIAGLLIDRQPAAALAAAERAASDANGIGPTSVVSLQVIQRIHLRLGHTKDAAAAGDAVARRMQQFPSEAFRQVVQHNQAGILALDRHDTAAAIRELEESERVIARIAPTALPDFDLARAYFDAGNDGEAASRFERIVNGGVRRAFIPVVYVRSLYFLGQISERKGDRAKAIDYYRRFVGYWGEGDIDRDRVADARKKIAG
ncbi:MAG TPA: FlgO family outer membrane protein, partial [Vicinamibacterales bacterium]